MLLLHMVKSIHYNIVIEGKNKKIFADCSYLLRDRPAVWSDNLS